VNKDPPAPAAPDAIDAQYQRKLVDQRFGVGAKCSACRHAYKVRIDPTSIESQLECRGAPPLAQFVHTANAPNGAPVMSCIQPKRIVHPDYCCGAFFVLPKDALQ
jgi:hypothetical protein